MLAVCKQPHDFSLNNNVKISVSRDSRVSKDGFPSPNLPHLQKITQILATKFHWPFFLYQSHENAFSFYFPSISERDALDGEKNKSLCVTPQRDETWTTPWKYIFSFSSLRFVFFSRFSWNMKTHLPFFSSPFFRAEGGRKNR